MRVCQNPVAKTGRWPSGGTWRGPKSSQRASRERVSGAVHARDTDSLLVVSSSGSHPDVECVMRIEVLAYRGNLPVAEGDQEVVLLTVVATVPEIAARFHLDRHVIALCYRARDRHLQPIVELREHAIEESP